MYTGNRSVDQALVRTLAPMFPTMLNPQKSANLFYSRLSDNLSLYRLVKRPIICQLVRMEVSKHH